MTHSGGSYIEQRPKLAAEKDDIEKQVAASKDNLLRMVEHLRRETSYDYPPLRVFELLHQVETAARSYRVAWNRRAAFENNHPRPLDVA